MSRTPLVDFYCFIYGLCEKSEAGLTLARNAGATEPNTGFVMEFEAALMGLFDNGMPVIHSFSC